MLMSIANFWLCAVILKGYSATVQENDESLYIYIHEFKVMGDGRCPHLREKNLRVVGLHWAACEVDRWSVWFHESRVEG